MSENYFEKYSKEAGDVIGVLGMICSFFMMLCIIVFFMSFVFEIDHYPPYFVSFLGKFLSEIFEIFIVLFAFFICFILTGLLMCLSVKAGLANFYATWSIFCTILLAFLVAFLGRGRIALFAPTLWLCLVLFCLAKTYGPTLYNFLVQAVKKKSHLILKSVSTFFRNRGDKKFKDFLTTLSIILFMGFIMGIDQLDQLFLANPGLSIAYIKVVEIAAKVIVCFGFPTTFIVLLILGFSNSGKLRPSKF